MQKETELAWVTLPFRPACHVLSFGRDLVLAGPLQVVTEQRKG